ncbi:MAG: S-methyl-5-thioribose kinase [Rhodothermales bacterium]
MTPSYPLFSRDTPDEITAFLRDQGFFEPDEQVEVLAKAGEGNMNVVLRVTTSRRTVILKQARPWVAKYPQIPAPEGRAQVEAAFYAAVASNPTVTQAMPKLLAHIPEAHVLLFEDLGSLDDATALYTDGKDDLPALPMLCRWLSALHNSSYEDASHAVLTNQAMRELNHEHLFRYPLLPENGLDLDAITPGLQAEADRLKQNTAYVEAITQLGEHYLSKAGGTLLHGDYYPGSWLVESEQVFVIDPEFCFLGPAEYDVGVLAAHLAFAKRPLRMIQTLFEHYDAPTHFDPALALQFAGMEWMRRLIGVAQLPLQMRLDEKAALLQHSEQFVLHPEAALAALAVAA